MQNIRILEIPDCRMVASGWGMFGEGPFERFAAWFSSQPSGVYPMDFLAGGERGLCWYYLWREGMDVPAEFEIVDFPGGLYAVATDVDQQTDTDAMAAEIDGFLAAHGFLRDPSRLPLGNIPTPPSAQKAMGFAQMDYWFPVRIP